MTEKVRIGVVALSWVIWSCLTCSTAVLLSSCATHATGGNMNTDLVTESDESDTHKRARLRLSWPLRISRRGRRPTHWITSSNPLRRIPRCLRLTTCGV